MVGLFILYGNILLVVGGEEIFADGWSLLMRILVMT